MDHPASAPTLPTDQAFVVQFGRQVPGQPMRYAGRVEHLVSGEARHFHSLADLCAFIVYRDEGGKRLAFRLAETLRASGISADMSFGDRALRKRTLQGHKAIHAARSTVCPHQG